MPLRVILVGCVSFLGLSACHDHDDHDHSSTDEIAEGCKHLEFGPDMPLDLSDGTVETSAATVHTRYMVTLAAGDDGASGAFSWTSSGGHHYFLFDRPSTMAVTHRSWPEGTVLMPIATHTAPVASCAVAASISEFMLPAGDHPITVTSAEAMLQMVIHFAGSQPGHAEGGEHYHGEAG